MLMGFEPAVVSDQPTGNTRLSFELEEVIAVGPVFRSPVWPTNEATPRFSGTDSTATGPDLPGHRDLLKGVYHECSKSQCAADALVRSGRAGGLSDLPCDVAVW